MLFWVSLNFILLNENSPSSILMADYLKTTQTNKSADHLLVSASQVTLKAMDHQEDNKIQNINNVINFTNDDAILNFDGDNSVTHKLQVDIARLVPIDNDSTSSYKSRERRRSSVVIDKRAYYNNQQQRGSFSSYDPEDCKFFGV